MNNTWNYDVIMSDKDIFYKTVYTPLSEAIKILEERQKDRNLQEKIEKLLDKNIPAFFDIKSKNAFQFRQIATPNYEGQWFIKITQTFNLKSNFCEFYDDKFTTNNNFKLSLGQINIHHGFDKKGDVILEKINIIDLKENDGKKLKDIKTTWSESLSDFHHKIFNHYGLNTNLNFHDMSNWHKSKNKNSVNSYADVFLLFMTHGILFENFLISGSESKFTKEVVLPAFEKVVRLTGIKPLVVPIPPMDDEFNDFIVYHLPKIKSLIKI